MRACLMSESGQHVDQGVSLDAFRCVHLIHEDDAIAAVVVVVGCDNGAVGVDDVA